LAEHLHHDARRMSIRDQYFAGAYEILVGVVPLPHALNGEVEDGWVEAAGHRDAGSGGLWPPAGKREAAACGRLRERGKNASALIFFSERNLPLDANTTMQEMKRDAGVLEHFL